MFLELNTNTILEKLKNFIRNEVVMSFAAILALVSSFIALPKIEYIDFQVLILLFNLMIIIAAFKKLKVLDFISITLLSKCKSYRSISFTLILITFFSSMIVTNDVALITFVPLALIICKKANISSLKIIIFQTLAANLGSSFTPMGNPQNLYIYSYFNISPKEFFKITTPLVILFLFFLIAINITSNKDNLTFELEKVEISNKKAILYFSLLFALILLSVFHLIDYKLTFILTIFAVYVLDKELFKKVDYSLLLTFIFFFIFIGNISSLNSVKSSMSNLLDTNIGTYFSGILLSQGISNVPATMLLSNFTSYYKELLLGVNIGGMGTIIASMASVISYKLYIKENETLSGKYMKTFTLYNLLGLIILIPIILFLL